MTYRAYGSFAPLYTEAIDRLYQELYPDRARQAENVLRRIAEHASPIGTCWPGIDRLMETCHYGFGTVKRSLIFLTDHVDYVRFHVEYSRTRRRKDITWQIDPRVLWIAPDYISEAESLWNTALKGCNVIFNGQPDSEPESEPDALTRTRTRLRTTTTTKTSQASKPKPEQRGAPKPAGKARSTLITHGDWPSEPESVTEGNQNPPARSAQTESPPNSAPPPPSLDLCRDPLPDADAESFAQQLAKDLSTRPIQARQLVMQFGVLNIHVALNWLKTERKEGRGIRSPFGLIKWWLTSNVLDSQPLEDAERYVTGDFSDFIKK